MDKLLSGTDIEALKQDEAWTDEQYRAVRNQIFAKMRMDYLNALYARGLRGNREREMEVLAAIDAFQDFIRSGNLPE